MDQRMEVGSTIREAAVVVVVEEEVLMIAREVVDLEALVARRRYELLPLSFLHL
jgi:hypothetical protein